MKLLFSLFMLLPLTTFAQGDHSGGGGDIVICRAPKIQKNFFRRVLETRKLNYYLLDVYEGMKAEKPARLINMGGPELSMHQKISLVASDFAELDPARAARYEEEAHKIAEDLLANENDLPTPHGIAIILDQRLKDIPDQDDKFKFSVCKKEQLVRQEPNPLAQTYTFDKKWWDKLDLDNKVATIYHEVIYHEFREYGAPNSRPARLLNTYLFSRSSKKLTLSNYLNFLSLNKARKYVFKSNIGDVQIYNLEEKKNVWSASISDSGYVSQISLEHAAMKTSDLPWSPLDLNVQSMKFSRSRVLTAITGNFSISFKKGADKLLSTRANCATEKEVCLSANQIEVEPDKTFRMMTPEGMIHFTRNGDLLKN